MSENATANWSSVFDEIWERTTPANPRDVASLLDPLTPQEVASVRADPVNPFHPGDPNFEAWRPIDPSKWRLPTGRLPDGYRRFLAWSDGASWRNGEREFSCFGCAHVREYAVSYAFPEFMPGALPIGLDGGSVFGVFDLRDPSNPPRVWAAGSGALFWDDAVLIADTFTDVCRGRRSVGYVYSDGSRRSK